MCRSRVALFTRAWIEIFMYCLTTPVDVVALFTRAWIEIDGSTPFNYVYTVALFTRAWIEIGEITSGINDFVCRPLHEGVD